MIERAQELTGLPLASWMWGAAGNAQEKDLRSAGGICLTTRGGTAPSYSAARTRVGIELRTG